MPPIACFQSQRLEKGAPIVALQGLQVNSRYQILILGANVKFREWRYRLFQRKRTNLIFQRV